MATERTKRWSNYEEVTAYLLNELGVHFGLDLVEGKQSLPGASGADWEIDAKGALLNNDGFLLI